MSAYVKEIKDASGNVIYPPTKANAVYMRNTNDTVERILDDMEDADTEIEFLSSGNIKKTLASGNTVLTEFMADGNINETTSDKDGEVLQTKTTSFEDNKIHIHIQEGDE